MDLSNCLITGFAKMQMMQIQYSLVQWSTLFYLPQVARDTSRGWNRPGKALEPGQYKEVILEEEENWKLVHELAVNIIKLTKRNWNAKLVSAMRGQRITSRMADSDPQNKITAKLTERVVLQAKWDNENIVRQMFSLRTSEIIDRIEHIEPLTSSSWNYEVWKITY